MSLYFSVADNLKIAAERSSAVWDEDKEAWYLKNSEEYLKNKRLILNGREECVVVHNKFYIMLEKQVCCKCGRETIVVGFGIEDFYVLYDKNYYDADVEDEHSQGFIFKVSDFKLVSDEVSNYLKEKFCFYADVSDSAGFTMNHCNHCGAAQGDCYLYDDMHSECLNENEEQVSDIQLIEVGIKDDLIIDYNSIDVLGFDLDCFKNIMSYEKFKQL